MHMYYSYILHNDEGYREQEESKASDYTFLQGRIFLGGDHSNQSAPGGRTQWGYVWYDTVLIFRRRGCGTVRRRLRVYYRGQQIGRVAKTKGYMLASIEAVKVAFEDALAHGGRGAARPAVGGTEGGGTAGLAVAAKGEAAVGGTDGRVGRRVGRRALAIRGGHEDAAAEREAAQKALAALVVGVRERGVRLRGEAPGNSSACAAGVRGCRHFFLAFLFFEDGRSAKLAERAFGRRLGEEIGQNGRGSGGRNVDSQRGCRPGHRSGDL